MVQPFPTPYPFYMKLEDDRNYSKNDYKGMLMTFRVSELQMLLGYASQNKTGRKSELQARALSLLKHKSVPHLTQIHAKIRELYKTISQGGGVEGVPGSGPLIASSNQRTSANSSQPSATSSSSNLIGGSLPAVNSTGSAAPINPTVPISNSFMPLSSRQDLYNQMYGYSQPKLPIVPSVAPPYPQQNVPHADVKFKSLPFYDLLSEIIKPSSLASAITDNPLPRGHESKFVFYLSCSQASMVASVRELGPGSKNEYPVLVQLRFCLLDSSVEQDDIFPPGITVKVNGKIAPLPNPIPTNRPGVEPKRPPRPVNISSLIKLDPMTANQITVNWNSDYTRGYVLALHLVRKVTADDLLDRLRTKGVRKPDLTRKLIKEKLDESDADCEIATTSLRVSLMCPLGKMKMSVPARSTLCSHLQCFDASFYLQMNEKRPTWTCPVCDKQIPFKTIEIDGYFQEVLDSPNLASDKHEVQLLKDGSWSCSVVTKEESQSSVTAEETLSETIEEILDDGDDDVIAVSKKIDKGQVQVKKSLEKKMVEIDLTTSDSENEEPAPNKSNHIETPPPSNRTHHTVSEGSNSSVGVRSVNSSVITLDSPSPPVSPVDSTANTAATTNGSSAATNHTTLPSYHNRSNVLYPQIIQGAGQNPSRPLVMQLRLNPTQPTYPGRYHPY